MVWLQSRGCGHQASDCFNHLSMSVPSSPWSHGDCARQPTDLKVSPDHRVETDVLTGLLSRCLLWTHCGLLTAKGNTFQGLLLLQSLCYPL